MPGCAGRGPRPRIACPVAARDRRKLGYQVLVQGFLARGRRSSWLMPPHRPWSCRVSSAKARHCCRTGQPAQIAFACVIWSREGPDAETGKNSSGSACRHAARCRQSWPGTVIIWSLPGALKGARRVRRAGRGNPPGEIPAGRPGPTQPTWPDTPRRRSSRTAAASKILPRTPPRSPAAPRRPSRTGCGMCAGASAAWSPGPGNGTPPFTRCWRPGTPSARSAARSAWTARPCSGPPASPTWTSSWSRPPAGTTNSTRSSPGSTSGGTRASPTPPRCTPNCKPAAGPAACRRCAATSARSARRPPRRCPSRPCPRHARSPAGCSATRRTSATTSRHTCPRSAPAARTSTPWPAT